MLSPKCSSAGAASRHIQGTKAEMKVDEVSDKLRKLARVDAYKHHAASLRLLADDLATDRATLWADVDLFQLFDEDSIVLDRSRRWGRVVAGFEQARTVLVLVPLLVTWLGVYFAISDYRRLLRRPDDQLAAFEGQSFMQLWSTGFGRGSWWTFDHVAMLDIAAIGAVIAVSVAIGVLRRHFDRLDDDDRTGRRGDLHSVLRDATLAVAFTSATAPDRFSSNLKDLLPTYQATLDQLGDVQRELSTVLNDSVGYVKDMADASTTLAGASTTIAGSAGNLQGEVHKFESKVRSLVAGTSDLGAKLAPIRDDVTGLTSALKALEDTHRSVAGNISFLSDERATTTRAVADAEKALTGAAEALPGNLADAGQELVRAVHGELDERRSAAVELSGAARSAADMANAAQRAAGEITHAAGQAAASLEEAIVALRQAAASGGLPQPAPDSADLVRLTEAIYANTDAVAAAVLGPRRRRRHLPRLWRGRGRGRA